jgi:hypothetical protein
MPHDPPKPQFEFLFRASLMAGIARSVGRTPVGERRIVEIVGGEVTGPKLTGTVLPGGADWQVVRDDGTTVLEARYTVQTEDGSLVYVQHAGFRYGPPDLPFRIARGEDVDPARYYFRTAPTFETSAPALAWLNRTVAVCTGMRTKDRAILDFYAVR